MDNSEILKLDNQLCFPLYAASRLVTKLYQPLLKELDITYPQYLILLVLWEEDNLTVNAIGNKLILETNTLTPLLKRMEQKGLLTRTRSDVDERKVYIQLTDSGRALKGKALCIPVKMIEGIAESASADKLIRLKDDLKELITLIQ